MTICPWTVAGMVNALSGPTLTTNTSPDLQAIALRIPHAFLWMWLTILAFAVTNQRSASSISEDAANKPWRPIPSGRLTATQSRNLLLVILPLVLVITTWLGAGNTAAIALVLTWMYNDLGGSDIHYIIRNLINASAMIVASMGITRVAMHSSNREFDFNHTGYQWLGIKAGIIFTTLQVQDLRDQEGDRLRGRQTLPIVLGDSIARWSVAVPILFWSFFCPFYWNGDFWAYLLPLALGLLLSTRVVALRSIETDQLTWKLRGLWTFSVFMLPLYTSMRTAPSYTLAISDAY